MSSKWFSIIVNALTMGVLLVSHSPPSEAGVRENLARVGQWVLNAVAIPNPPLAPRYLVTPIAQPETVIFSGHYDEEESALFIAAVAAWDFPAHLDEYWELRSQCFQKRPLPEDQTLLRRICNERDFAERVRAWVITDPYYFNENNVRPSLHDAKMALFLGLIPRYEEIPELLLHSHESFLNDPQIYARLAPYPEYRAAALLEKGLLAMSELEWRVLLGIVNGEVLDQRMHELNLAYARFIADAVEQAPRSADSLEKGKRMCAPFKLKRADDELDIPALPANAPSQPLSPRL